MRECTAPFDPRRNAAAAEQPRVTDITMRLQPALSPKNYQGAEPVIYQQPDNAS
jgi:hypothetical protein